MEKALTFLLLIPLLVYSQSDFGKAEKLFLAGKYEQAKPVFEKYYKENPAHLKTIEYLGDIAGHQKEWEVMLGYFKKLKSLKPSVANYYFKYGAVLAMIAKESNKLKAFGMIGEIKGSFEKAIALNPKHIEARYALIAVYTALPIILGGSESKSIHYSNELLQISPIDGYISRGKIEEHYKRYAAAEKQYLKAYEIGKSKISYQLLYKLYLNKLKDAKKAQNLKEQFERK